MRDLIISLFLLLFCLSCANQTQPTGGPKDEEPPTLLTSSPEQGSINVSTDKIELTFNEYVKVENAKEQLIITPRVDIEYEIKYRKNKAIITFEKLLPDSTTFTFNFREAIVDITEGNSPENLKLAFSTGHFLDSLSLSGNVRFNLDDALGENVTVSLYEESDTLDLFTGPPLYFTKTNENGDYLFENLKVGTYKLYTYTDNNKNLIAESKSESYGFVSGYISLDTSIFDLNLYLFNLDARTLEYQTARQSGTTFIIKYNKALADYQLVPNSEDDVIHTFSNLEQAEIRVYNTFDISDSLEVFVNAVDSIGQQTSDTVYIQFEPTQRKPLAFEHKLDLDKIIIEKRLLEGKITFNKPVTFYNLDSTYIYIDSTHIYPFDTTHLKWESNNTILGYSYLLDKELFEVKEDSQEQKESIEVTQDTTATDSVQTKPPKPDLKPHLRFGSSSFISAEYDSSLNISQDLSFIKSDKLGLISLTINTDETSFFVQLINSENEVVQQIRNQKEFDFEYITPGTYRIRILIDADQNGQWDNGNILTDTEPEPVIFYTQSTGEQELVLRANFELTPDPIEF